MKDEILLYSEFYESIIVESILKSFNIKKLNLNELKKNNYKNKNILIFLKDKNHLSSVNKIATNNSVLCLINQKNLDQSTEYANVLSSPLTISKFIEFANKVFTTGIVEYSDVEIFEKKITNKRNKKFTYFTDLENQIFSELLKKKELEKKFLKENILKIKNNIDTRSIESHFSRIRKKLSTIKSTIKITSKGEVFFIN